MTLEEFLRGFSQIFLLVVTVSTLFNWARYRDRTSRDIALVFLTLTATIILEDIEILLGVELPRLNMLGPLAVISHPYFLLRLARYFSPVRPVIQRAALIGLLVSWVVLILAREPFSVAAAAFVFSYFAVVEVYASSILVRGALTIPGITGKRLRLVSIGSGLLALLFIVAIVLLGFIQSGSAPPTLASDFGSMLQVFLLLSGLAYYFGFSPPRWLRRLWQLSELHHFLNRTSKQLADDRMATLNELSTAALRTVGGVTAAIAAYDVDEGQLRIELAGAPPLQADHLEAGTDAIGKAWANQKARAVELPTEARPEINRWAEKFNARSLFIVPIKSAFRPWGLLIVALRYEPLFPQDDLDLLALLAEQSATQLDHAALNQELQNINQSLEQRVVERTLLLEETNRALETQVNERKQAEEEILRLNLELEGRVVERTAQLEAANQELESFSYSVSHDLRTPLRSIDGYSQILLEDYSEQIPAEGRAYLERVRASAQRMSELIDDLLNLARVTKSAVQPEQVNLSQLVESIARELQQQNSERILALSITPDLTVHADPRLLRIVLENLLGNAWKFTSKTQQAVIEFGRQNNEGQHAFFIRDNGAGFDMAHANKLFGAFQRLHKASDYPGTGIGLATVQRIIRLHGGNIWAESQPDQGATFYFTL